MQVFGCSVCACLRRISVLDITINDTFHRVIGVYEPNEPTSAVVCLSGSFFITSHQVVLPGDWNGDFDPDIDRIVTRWGTNNPIVK